LTIVLADAGVENGNARRDAFISTGVLRRVLAFTELNFSNSMIEAWWRPLNMSGSSSTLTVSPNGSRILYSRIDSSVDDVMLVEHFR
jgi:hypothetical protein